MIAPQTTHPANAPVTPAAPDGLALRRVKLRSYLISGVVVTVSGPLSLLIEGDGGFALASLLVAYGFFFFALGALVRWTRLPLSQLGVGAVLTSVALLALATHLVGGVVTPAFSFLVFLPLLVAVIAPENRVAVFTAVISSFVAASALHLLTTGPSEDWLGWVVVGTVVGLFSVQGTRQYQRLLAAQRAADEERIRTLHELAQSEARRAAAERLALVGQLAAGVAHEINNPLSFATSNVRYVLAELNGADSQELQEALRDAELGLDRIAQIVRDLKASARADEPASDVTCTLDEAVQEAVRIAGVRVNRSAEVLTELPCDLPPVRFHARHLVQVVVNLLVNAADALEDRGRRGTVTLRVKRVSSPARLRLEVDDDGPGIPVEVLPRVFDPFFTTKPVGKGTGLGLPLSREYARRYGGELHAGNRPEGGARMALELLPA